MAKGNPHNQAEKKLYFVCIYYQDIILQRQTHILCLKM